MSTQVLKDNRGFVIGRIKTQGNKWVIYCNRGFKLGSYDGKYTYNKSGFKIGSGNLLATLL